MAEAARESRVWVLGGSIPEAADGRLYNCATVWSPDGALVQTYRKTHLFDLCLPKMTYKESDTFGAGDRLATFDTRACPFLPRLLSVRPLRRRHLLRHPLRGDRDDCGAAGLHGHVLPRRIQHPHRPAALGATAARAVSQLLGIA